MVISLNSRDWKIFANLFIISKLPEYPAVCGDEGRDKVRNRYYGREDTRSWLSGRFISVRSKIVLNLGLEPKFSCPVVKRSFYYWERGILAIFDFQNERLGRAENQS